MTKSKEETEAEKAIAAAGARWWSSNNCRVPNSDLEAEGALVCSYRSGPDAPDIQLLGLQRAVKIFRAAAQAAMLAAPLNDSRAVVRRLGSLAGRQAWKEQGRIAYRELPVATWYGALQRMLEREGGDVDAAVVADGVDGVALQFKESYSDGMVWAQQANDHLRSFTIASAVGPIDSQLEYERKILRDMNGGVDPASAPAARPTIFE